MKIKWPRKCLLMAFASLAVALSSCVPSRYVKPLEKGEVAASATLGGILFKNFGFPLPTPFATVGAGYGIKEDLTAYGGLNLTSLAFGNVQFDLGMTKSFLEPEGWRPGISVSPSLNVVGSFNNGGAFRVWPALDVNAWWEYNEKGSFFYAGMAAWFELAGTRANGAQQPQHILPGVQLGHTFMGKSLDFTAEVKWSNFVTNNRDSASDWIGIGEQGAVGVFLGITKRFGK